MSIFDKLRNAFARFMYGRNGADALCRAAVIASLAVNLLSVFVVRRFQAAGSLLYYAGIILLVWALFRMFSRNLSRRQSENGKWLTFWTGLQGRRRSAAARRADKDHRYFTCKNCKAVCRVPAGKGSIVITCPRCGAEIKAKT